MYCVLTVRRTMRRNEKIPEASRTIYLAISAIDPQDQFDRA